MKYRVTTAYLIGGGDMSHRDEWVFNTKEEAQKFLDKFYEAFPKDDCSMDDPYICTNRWKPEIEEIDDTCADPYAWLERKIKEKEER